MAKVMLVEDDNNLREIYQARLSAEGYTIVAAKDGEEALELAVKEKPDLMLLDVMMPKVSGFELLDILRSTEGIKYTKVIMMTALSQAEDKERAEKLGANRYLIKSQVTLEDMAKAVHDVLNEDLPANVAGAPAATPAQSPEQQLLTNAANTLSTSAPSTPNPITQSSGSTPDFGKNDAATTTSTSNSDDDGVTIAKKKIISPLNDPTKPKTNLSDLVAQEEAKESMVSGATSSNDSYAPTNSGNDDDVPAGSPMNNPLNQTQPDQTPGQPGGDVAI